MRDKPDSEALPLLDITVEDTHASDNPQFGAVTVRLKQTPQTSRVIRMTLDNAFDLHASLDVYLVEVMERRRS